MATTVETSSSIPKTVFDQAAILAQRLNISQSELFETAIEAFVKHHQQTTLLGEPSQNDQGQPAPHERADSSRHNAKAAMAMGGGRRVINQGDIYWVQLADSSEAELGLAHPYVVIQDNLFNHSRIPTVVACALTSNLKRVSDTPGNVLLDVGEANLPRQSVVEVSKISTVDKAGLGEYIGSLTKQRVNQILTGIRFLQVSFFTRQTDASRGIR